MSQVPHPFDEQLRTWDIDPNDYPDYETKAMQGWLDLKAAKRKLWKEKGYLHYKHLNDEDLIFEAGNVNLVIPSGAPANFFAEAPPQELTQPQVFAPEPPILVFAKIDAEVLEQAYAAAPGGTSVCSTSPPPLDQNMRAPYTSVPAMTSSRPSPLKSATTISRKPVALLVTCTLPVALGNKLPPPGFV